MKRLERIMNGGRHGMFCGILAGFAMTLLAVLLTGTAAGPAHAADADLLPSGAPEIKVVAGAWDIVSQPSGRSCHILLNGPKPGGNVLVAGIQPPCRTTMAPLVPVQQWGLGRDGRIRLRNAAGLDVLVFESLKQGENQMRFVAKSETGDIELVPAGQRYDAQRRPASVAGTVIAVQNASAGRATPQNDTAATGFAGRYRIARDASDLACTLTLGGLTPDNIREAKLDAGCQDGGLRIFDPVAWRTEGPRLFLIARKGHTIGFSRRPDGSFIRDPAQGKPLVLKKS